ncbi:MAG: hypothetical protein E7Z87_03535 [Cyanobacteria bacterium SIG26]|nr:hypothetical protein [Cyanobacteria bacterium SIG26]
MTYGVPYSFVPGTKARADEVNANFIDVLDKIQETNTRIEDSNSNLESEITSLNTKISEVDDNKLELDLSNINSNGQKLFDAKANTSQLDGNWVVKVVELCNAKSIAPSGANTYSLSSYLPDTTNKYEILATANAYTYNSTDSCAYMFIKTDWITASFDFVRMATRHNAKSYDTFHGTLLSSTGRSITVWNSSESINNTTYTLKLYAYRKVR